MASVIMASSHSKLSFRSTATAALCIVLGIMLGAALSAVPAQARTGAFAGYAGHWSGGGTITIANGGNERIRCRGVYTVERGGNALHQTLRCASDSYRFDLISDIRASGGALSGSWTETSRDLNGTVEGRVLDGEITALVQTAGYAAVFNVVTRGNRQSIEITSKGDLRAVSISLTRSK